MPALRRSDAPRYLLPLAWVAMSFAVDALVGFDVIESDDDWTPVSFALVLALPVGFALLALAGRFSRP